jgi:hypothetical protein
VKGIYYQVTTCGALCFISLSLDVWCATTFLDQSALRFFVCYNEFFDDNVMQAEVQGQKITWLTPHALQQVLTDDVDFNVMLTFLEFYEVKI